MKNVNVYQIDAFTKTPGLGNPAGVIPNGDLYTSEEMQTITKAVGFNECVFICSSDSADAYLRYFTPGYETPLCGHATIAAIYYLAQNLKSDKTFVIKTNAGILTMNYQYDSQKIEMQQAKPKTIAFEGNVEKLCSSIGISTDDLYPNLPITYGNTGSWTLLVPVKNETILDKMNADNNLFPDILNEVPKSSVHPFSIDDKEYTIFHARHFSSPFSQTKEDSVTGTASGVMGVYALDHIYPNLDKVLLHIHQGKQMNKEGSLNVLAVRNNEGHDIKIYGTAVFNKKLSISY